MTVQTSTTVATGIGNGVTTVFPIGFKFNQDEDLIVNVVDDAAQTETLLTLYSDYTVTGAGDENGGSITLTAGPLATGKSVVTKRVIGVLQLTDLRNQGKFFAEVHEDSFDKSVMIDQQQQEQLDRGLFFDLLGRWNAFGRRIINLGTPTQAGDAARKDYVDSGDQASRNYADDKDSANFAKTLRTTGAIGQIGDAASRAGKLLSFDSAGNPNAVAPNPQSATELAMRLGDAADDENGASIPRLTTAQGISLSVRDKITKGGEMGIIPSAGVSGKMIVRRGQYVNAGGITVGSRYWVILAKAAKRGGHILAEMRRGVVTSTGSLGGPAELLRVTSLFNLSQAWIGRHARTAVSSEAHWSESTYTQPGTSTIFEHGESVNKYWAVVGAGAARWIEFNVPFSSSGEANIQFYCTPASAVDAEISIDGVIVRTLNLSSAGAVIYRLPLNAAAGFHTVRVSQGVSAGALNVFGANYGDVKDYPNYDFPSGLVAWGDGGTWTSGEGANDYAILDAQSGLFGGSFHGGETMQSETFVIDGAIGDPLAAIRPCSTLEIRQRTTIDWSGSGGGSLQVYSNHSFDSDAGYSFSASFEGGVQTSTFYSAMHTTPESFSEIISPKYVDVSAEAASFITLPRSDVVVQEEPGTGRRVYTKVGLIEDDEANIYGGPSIRKTTGSYNKFYYGPAISSPSPVVVTSLSCAMSKHFV